MAVERLETLPAGSDVLIDANIFVYGLSGYSAQCRRLLDRCLKEEVLGISLFEVLNEATHRFMLKEAFTKGFVNRESAGELKKKHAIICQLKDYWHQTERLLALNLLFLSTSGSVVQSAQKAREDACLLTNDSMIVSCMREYGIRFLATHDADFERVHDITIFCPDDVP